MEEKTLPWGQNGGEDTTLGAEWRRRHYLGGRMKEKTLPWGQNEGENTTLGAE